MHHDALNHHHRHSFSWHPEPLLTPKHHARSAPSTLRSRQASTYSERSCSDMSAEATQELWRCMLELQQRYGCYTSARIDMALEAGEGGVDLMPNRFVIDTLNESVVDMPDDGRDMLDRFLSPTGEERRTKWKFWKKA